VFANTDLLRTICLRPCPVLLAASLLCGCQAGNERASSSSATRIAAPAAPANVRTAQEYWPDGNLRLRKDVLDRPDGTAVNHGTYTRWYPSGQKEYEATFDHGRKHGRTINWHKNGQVWMEQYYQHGQRHGPGITWDADGNNRKEENHRHGRPHGTWTVWAKDGTIKWQGYFERGEPVDRPPGGDSAPSEADAGL
jgi:hypothetical protein